MWLLLCCWLICCGSVLVLMYLYLMIVVGEFG